MRQFQYFQQYLGVFETQAEGGKPCKLINTSLIKAQLLNKHQYSLQLPGKYHRLALINFLELLVAFSQCGPKRQSAFFTHNLHNIIQDRSVNVYKTE